MGKYLLKVLTFIDIKAIVKRKIIIFKLFNMQLFNSLFNNIVVSHNENYKSIPIIIISFNQLFYLKQLIDFLKKHKYENIVIIDNNSTYQPLLDYFKQIESSVTLHRLNMNYGHLVFWKNKALFEEYSKGYYVVTDADIVPIFECPDDFLMNFKKILDKDFRITKVGFSLKIDDIPESNNNKGKILDWESKFYKIRNKEGNFIADIDTTFALYRPNYKLNESDFYCAYRTQIPYVAQHGGWYLDNEHLTEEQKFFFAHCNESSSWRINKEGKINKKIYLK